MTILLILLAGPSARAHESEPQHFLLEDRAEFFTGSEYDTDWMPEDSPLAVRFQIVADGGAGVEMEGDGQVEWPEALTLGFTGEKGTGLLVVDSGLSAVTSVKFEVSGYAWESEIDRRGIDVTAEGIFDPFLLDGSDPDEIALDFSGFEDDLIDFEYTVFTGVSLVFAAAVHPESETVFSGVSWTAEDAVIEEEGGTALIPPIGQPALAVESTFRGAWQSYLDLVLTPSMEVCVDLVGCWELVAFDIPITLAEDDFEQDFPALPLSFPLPVIVTEVDSYDFGQVVVGQLANLQLPVGNVGELAVEGGVGVLGSSWFTAYPEYVYAGPGEEDGVVVTFAPEDAGVVEATLVFETNDPLFPLYEVTLTGEGVLPDEPSSGDDPGDSEVIQSEVRGCGCASLGDARPLPLLLTALGLVFVRHRRRGR